MRRVVLWLLGTAVGTTVLVGVKAAPGSAPSSAVGEPAAPGTAGGTAASAGSDAPAAASRPTGTPARSGAAVPTKAAPPPARTILGTAYPARDFGDVQVKVVMTGTHIDDILVVQMSNRPLNAPTLLRRQALAKQSATGLSNVSGATYTSRAYVQSLQSALAKA